MRKRFYGAMTALAFAGALVAGGQAMAAPKKLNVNFSVVPPHLISVLYMKKDLFHNAGKTYEPKFIKTRGSALVLTAMAAGEIDLGVLSTVAFSSGLLNAKLPLVAIADLVLDGPWFTAKFAVKEDSPIKSVKDLKGKTLAINAFGGALDAAARSMVVKAGMTPGKDVTIVEGRFPAQESMVRSGKVDAGVFIAAFWDRARKKGGLRTIFTSKDAIGDSQFLFWVVKKDFMEKNRAVLTDFFTDYIRAQRWFLDPKNRAEALAMIAKHEKKKVANFEWAIQTETGYFRDTNLRFNKKAFEGTSEVLHKLGFIKAPLDASKVIDESIIIEAAKRLK
jgi:sulfonate transport system substrate-binding protein